MKKSIAILAVLILALSCVMAETPASENHTIAIGTVIGEVTPSFQLRYGASGSYTNTAADANTLAKNNQFGQFTDGETYNAGPVMTGKDLSKDDISADFYAVLAIGARSTKSYTLKFTAGPFETTVKGVAHDVLCTASSITSALPNDVESIVRLDGASASPATNIKSQDIRFYGSAATTKIDLVRFSATWTKDNAIDMGTFYANVSLDITVK